MKRNEFLKASILSSISMGIGSLTFASSFKKLEQIKEFNIRTVDQIVGAEIMSKVAWNHLNEPKYIGKLEIIQEYQYINRTGPGVTTSSVPGPGFKTEEHGITIFSPVTEQYVRIWPDGDWHCYRKASDKDEYKHVVEGKNGYRREETRLSSGHGLNQVKVIEIYLKFGFYSYM